MKTRSARDIEKALLAKGFQATSTKKKSHHYYYHFFYKGKKSNVYTYLSHGAKSMDYGKRLMNEVKNQLKFQDSSVAEAFLDCPFKEEDYIAMLKKNGELE